MEYVIAIGGSIGAWLLVAGPIYQASLELGEQEIDQERFESLASSVEAPPRPSPWWWLLPPVAYFLQRKRSQRHRQAVMDALGPEELTQTVAFLNKARGWLIVALGAFLIAFKETWEVTVLLEWPAVVFWMLVVLMIVLSLGNTILSTMRTHRVLR